MVGGMIGIPEYQTRVKRIVGGAGFSNGCRLRSICHRLRKRWVSISSPSTRCGTTGLRPTFGFVPRTGAMALSWTMDKLGPICRAVEDTAIVLSAIHGPDGHDRTVTQRSVQLGRQPRLAQAAPRISEGRF